jgi:hypothetical protein
MAVTDSALDKEAMARARALLLPAKPRERVGPALAAAAFAAICALSLAVAMIVAPPSISEHVLTDRDAR